ncbi:MAG: hypothetical protein K8R92_05990 [Planctomycetes bacterium]|nr:hypothetical protein [Planctomycetota bacterium]
MNPRLRRAVLVSMLFLISAAAAIQTLRLDPPPTPKWPAPASVDILADALVREADKLDTKAAKPSAQAAWRRMAAAILRAHGTAPLKDSTPAAMALVMVSIRRDLDPRLDTPAGELFAAEWNARPDPKADPMPEFARLLAGIAETSSTQDIAPPCDEAKAMLKDLLPILSAADTAPDLAQSTAGTVAAANQAAAALCSLRNAAYWNNDTRDKIAAQIEAAVRGLAAAETREESIKLCAKFGALAQAVEALGKLRDLAASSTAARSDKIPGALLAVLAKKDPVSSALALSRVAKIIGWMADAQQIKVDAIAPPLRNFARSLARRAVASERLGLARIETLSVSGFDANDPSLATIFVAQEQLVEDINMLQRLSTALNNDKPKQSKQTKQLIALMQTMAGGLDDKSFSEMFRERLHAMDRQLAVLRAAEETPGLSAPVQAEAENIRQRWLDAWAANEPAQALESIRDFARWASAKRAMDALNASESAWPDARLDWAGSREALRQVVSDGESALATGNSGAMKTFLAPLRKEAAASLASGLRLASKPASSKETTAIVRDLCAIPNDRSAQVIAALLRLEQERQTLLKANPSLAREFLAARNEWVEELQPSLQDRLPDGLLPPESP